MNKLGRNDPCWCGSGKKYKKCHMLRDQRGRLSAFMKPPLRAPVRTAEEIEGMRRAGRFNGELMDVVRQEIRAGISSADIDRLVDTYTRDHGHVPATFGYRGFPKSCCVSVNEVVCHGIPSPDVILKEGDIVNVDLTTIVDGFYGDQSETFMIGEVSDEARQLVLDTARATLIGIDAVRVGATTNVIGKAIEAFAHARGYGVVREYTGHGIGREFHENYSIFHFDTPEAERVEIVPGMTFTVEPMLNLGTWRTDLDPDGWTVRTSDRKLSAQFEHTILVTRDGVEILTLTPSQREAGKRLIVDGVEFD
ncbi:MAG: type I methionyl aminopeptidase [Candidatus Dadabacteria bacterium]|nr:MAG: type I methionyl aminopeptidase [Candidatus Dadabacteria bacterium]